MRKVRFTEHQSIAVIKSVDAGRTVKDVYREAGISETIYLQLEIQIRWHGVSDIKKIKDPGDENPRLKQSFADLSLENRTLKDVIEKSVKTSL